MKHFVVPLVMSTTLSIGGCSYVQGYFSTTDEASMKQAAETVAETVKTAAENSDNAEQSTISTMYSKASEAISQTLSETLTGEGSRTKVSISAQDNEDTSGSILNVSRLGTDTKYKTDFIQSSLMVKPKRSTVNLGMGRRYITEDESTIYGANAFVDYAPDYGHQRASLGVEVKRSAIELTANKYFRLSGWKSGKNGKNERVMDGHEIELGGQVPYIPSAKVFIKNWEWKGVSKIKGYTYSMELSQLLINHITVEAGVKDFDGSTDSENFIKLSYNYRFGDDGKSAERSRFISSEMFESKSMRPHLLDEVRRSNEIVYETEFSTSAGGV